MTADVVAHSLLEREQELTRLDAALTDALGGSGRLVLVAGEAGVGKTTLARALCSNARGSARSLIGACDPVGTPRPFGPFADIALTVGGELAAAAANAAGGYELLTPLLRELQTRPTVLVLEDVHWADDATLDLILLLGRRVETSRALVVATYREEELSVEHRLQLVIGALLLLPGVDRMRLRGLSQDAVRTLAGPLGIDGDQLYRHTGGNPFFVTEVLGGRGAELPDTIRDAVIARAGQLGEHAREVLGAVSIEPRGLNEALVEALVGDELDGLDECVARGMLVDDRGVVSFRHELARRAVEGSLPQRRRRSLHRALLAVLLREPERAVDSARLAYHAERAGDEAAVLTHAPAAAHEASAAGAHREAAAQYGRALEHGGPLDGLARAALLAARGRESALAGLSEQALAARREALALYDAHGERLRVGEQLCQISRLLSELGRRDECEAALRDARALLEDCEPGRELALAYALTAGRRALELDVAGARAWGDRAVALAEAYGDVETATLATVRVGGVEAIVEGRMERIGRGLALALEHRLPETVAIAYDVITVAVCRRRDHVAAERVIADGLRHSASHGLEGSRAFLVVWRAVNSADRGNWDAATRDAASILRDPLVPAIVRGSALLVVGTLRARRGDPDVWGPLDEVSAMGPRVAEHAKNAAVTLARAEAAMLEGSPERAREELEAHDPHHLSDRWVAGALAVWARRADRPAEVVGELPTPFARELAGDHAGASQAWTALGCPYDAAMALVWGDDQKDLRSAHDELRALGANAAAKLVARRLRAQGARGVARGPRASTDANAAGLTTRQAEVLGLVAAGMRNAEIAERLHLSTRTVDHHVSAILRKLDASGRGEAVANARKIGLLAEE